MDNGNMFDPSQVSPAMLQQLVALGGAQDRQALLGKQMQYGREDSQMPMPQGQTVGPMHGYVAASPMEHIAAALQRGMGLAQQRGAASQIGQSIQGQTAGRNAYADALMRMMGGQGVPDYVPPASGTGEQF